MVDAVLPETVRLTATEVLPHRRWRDIRDAIEQADLPDPVRVNALRTFGQPASAEAKVHGSLPQEVHFHEVGAWDSIADVVGVCAALHLLRVTSVSPGAIALGSGRF